MTERPRLLIELARGARFTGHIVPPWLVEEAWRLAWDAEWPPGKLEEVQGVALRSLAMRVRQRARQMMTSWLPSRCRDCAEFSTRE